MHTADTPPHIRVADLPLTRATVAETVGRLRDRLATAETQASAYRSALAELTEASRRVLTTIGHGHRDRALRDHVNALRDAIRRAGEAHLKATNRCRCTWLGIGTPEHAPASLCLTPEQDEANCQRAAASVPHVARESQLRLVDEHAVLDEVAAERAAQDARWGQQNHPDGTGQWVHEQTSAMLAREAVQKAMADGTLTWAQVLREEVYEALAEDAPARVRAELVQVAAVAVAWVEAIDRRPDAQ